MRKGFSLGWADLLVGLFLVTLASSVGISAITSAREKADRAKCVSNLHQIGLAILLYQSDNMQMFPRSVGDDAENPKPVWGTPYQADPKIGPQQNVEAFGDSKAAPAANDVTASLFLLLRNEQLTSSVFVCPESNLRPWNFGGGNHSAQDWTNWDGNSGLARHLSYGLQNPFVSKAAVEAGYQMKNPDATMAVAADMNPGGEAVTSVTINSSVDEMRKANSLNHHSEGQNVLYGDGHVEWQSTPFCGTEHDNIYTAGGPEIKTDERTKAVVAASPVSMTDSILLPTAADIGFKIRASHDDKPLNAEDRKKLNVSLEGKYTSAENGDEASLTIDDKTIRYEAAGATVDFNYDAIGGNGNTLVVKLTNPDTGNRERATVELVDGELTITTTRNNNMLSNSWRSEKAVGADK